MSIRDRWIRLTRGHGLTCLLFCRYPYWHNRAYIESREKL